MDLVNLLVWSLHQAAVAAPTRDLFCEHRGAARTQHDALSLAFCAPHICKGTFLVYCETILSPPATAVVVPTPWT